MPLLVAVEPQSSAFGEGIRDIGQPLRGLLAWQRLADTIPEGRRARFDLQLAVVRLALARRLGDLTVSLEMLEELKAKHHHGQQTESGSAPATADSGR